MSLSVMMPDSRPCASTRSAASTRRADMAVATEKMVSVSRTVTGCFGRSLDTGLSLPVAGRTTFSESRAPPWNGAMFAAADCAVIDGRRDFGRVRSTCPVLILTASSCSS